MGRFKCWTKEEFAQEVVNFSWTRVIDGAAVHGTWRPNHAQWKGEASMLSMWTYHTKTNGWADIAQHATIDPAGGIWSGRNWNAIPASNGGGGNGTSGQGPFMFEMVGDFDIGRDTLQGDQLESALWVICALQSKWGFEDTGVKFHRELPKTSKTCPGSGIDKGSFMELLGTYRASLS